MPSIGPMELMVVLVIALVILGPKRLPSAARSLGSGLRGFKDSLSGAIGASELEAASDETVPVDRVRSQVSASPVRSGA